MTVAPPNPPYVGPAPHTGGGGNKPIKRIVIHCTAGAEPGVNGAARTTATWTKRSGVVSSYHYVADARESVQLVYDSVIAYHCGFNSNSIGYELSCSLKDEGRGHWGNADHQAMLKVAAEDVARLCLAYGVPMRKLTVAETRAGLEGICGHVDIRDAFPGRTTHWDPGPHFPWDQFVTMVRVAADRLTKPTPPVKKPEPKPESEAPVKTRDPFTLALLPGRFDAPVEDWLRRRDEAIAEGADIVVFTEATRDRTANALAPDGYDSHRIPGAGPSNVMAVWDAERFELASDPYSVQLDTQQVWTQKGRLRPQTFAVVYPLRDVAVGKVLYLACAHLPLENTARRRAAKEEALAALPAVFDEAKRRHPGGARLIAADWNRNSKRASVRDWWAATFPSLTPAWVNKPRAVIDWQAGGGRLELKRRWFLKRKAGDPLDHRTTLATWAWDA